MSAFKVGHRVRYIGEITDRVPYGSCGVIVGDLHNVGYGEMKYDVEFFGLPCGVGPGTHWWTFPYNLAPLTPPATDAWATDAVRKVTKPQHVEPVVVKVTESK